MLALFCITLQPLLAQYTFTAGGNSLEVSGTISVYYNYRLLKPGVLDHDKDRFALRDAILQFEGRKADNLEYELQVDIADLVSANAGASDPENPGLMDAWVKYKGFRLFDIMAGYGKVPYSRASLTPNKASPYWSRAEVTRGAFFSRRDVGITLERNFLRERIRLYGGVYTGLGELTLRGSNDASGKPEAIGRAEFAWPVKSRYQEVDFRHIPFPAFAVGINGRYTDRTLPPGKTFPGLALSEYGIKVIDGEKYTWGADAMLAWKGFTLIGETHIITGVPADPGSALFQGLPDSLTQGYFRAGGYYVQASYCFRKSRCVLSARWEEYNLNDLVAGTNRRLAAAFNCPLGGSNSIIRLNYLHVMEEEPLDLTDWTDQFRLGWQISF